MPTLEEIENDRRVLTEVTMVKKENIEYWKSAGCGLDEPTTKKSIEIAERDIVKYQARLDALPNKADMRAPSEAVTETAEATEDEGEKEENTD